MLRFQSQSEVIGTFPIFEDLISRKRLVLEPNGPIFGPQGQVFSVYKSTFDC